MDRLQVNIRLDRELVRHLDELARHARLDRTEMARIILDEGVARHREERALEDYVEGNVTAWRAAELAGMSLYDMLDRIHDRHVIHELDPEVLDAIRRLPIPGGSPPDEGSSANEDRRPAVEPARRVAEEGSPYGSDASSGVDELRSRYQPASIRRLFVGESSPAGGTHFYRANSNLFRAIRDAFASAMAPERVPDGAAFLGFFAEQGCWLVDLADQPVNRMEDAARREMVEAGIDRLRETIEEVRPESIVAVKSSVAYAVRRAAQAAGSTAVVTVLPFPVRQWRSAFVQGLAAQLRSAGPDSGDSPRDAVPSAAPSAVSQRVTAADLRRGQIRIPSDGKSFFPAARGKVPVLLRDKPFNASYDPHYDADQERSGVLRIGAPLRTLVKPDERLALGRSPDGRATLD